MSVADDDCVALYVTCPDMKVSEELAKPLVEARLVACANILPGMVSIYRWQGEMMRDDEVVLILKTTSRLAQSVVDRLAKSHPYDLPAISIFPISGGHSDFLQWIRSETQ